jgi:hypothetical protein
MDATIADSIKLLGGEKRNFRRMKPATDGVSAGSQLQRQHPG